jgi:hypothetical protein
MEELDTLPNKVTLDSALIKDCEFGFLVINT